MLGAWLAAVLWVLSVTMPAVAAEAVTVDPHSERIDLSLAFQITPRSADGSGAVAPPADFPAPAGRMTPSGYTDSVLWGRVVLHNPSLTAIHRVLQVNPARLQSVRLFLRDAPGAWQWMDNGSPIPWLLRPLPSTALAFPIRLEPGAEVEVVIRAQSNTLLALYPTLWTPAAFQVWSLEHNLVLALSWGGLAALAAVALALAILDRDVMQLVMGLRLVTITLRDLAIFGIAAVFLWPEATQWDLRAPTALSGLALSLTGLFLLRFMPISQCSRTAWRLLQVCSVTYLALGLAGAAGAAHRLTSQMLLAMVIIGLGAILWVTLSAIRSGYRPARQLLPALIIGVVGGISRNAGAIGLLDETALGLLVPSLLIILGHVMFLTAIAERTKELRREKDGAQAQLLAVTADAQARLERDVDQRTWELRQAIAQLEQANRSKTRFLAQVSHELRTPLHTILGYADLLRAETWGRRIGDRLGVIAEGGRHLLRLIEDLVSFARGEYDTETLRPEPTYLLAFLRRVGDQAELLARRRGNRCELQADATLPVAVDIDVRRLEQVLLILLSNAANAMRDGDITLSVTASSSGRHRAALTFTVADTGPGIDPADQERIFEPFERGVTSRHDGLGLGLAIGRQIVERMGGRLTLDSRLGHGSRFSFTITAPEADEADIHLPADPPAAAGYHGPTRSVLVVEDTVPHRRLVAEVLSDLGFAVRCAGSVTEAMARLEEGGCDLMLLDQRLGDGTGWDVLRRLRDGAGTTPVIMLTAMAPAPPADWGDRSGPDAVLSKPLRIGELLEAVRQALHLEWQQRLDAPPPPLSPSPPSEPAPVQDAAEALPRLRELSLLGDVTGLELWLAEQRAAAILPASLLDRVAESMARFAFDEIAATAEEDALHRARQSR